MEDAEAGRALHALLDRRTRDEPAARAFIREHPSSIHWRGEDGRTALHLARGIDLLRALLDAGADPNSRDDDGAPPCTASRAAADSRRSTCCWSAGPTSMRPPPQAPRRSSPSRRSSMWSM